VHCVYLSFCLFTLLLRMCFSVCPTQCFTRPQHDIACLCRKCRLNINQPIKPGALIFANCSTSSVYRLSVISIIAAINFTALRPTRPTRTPRFNYGKALLISSSSGTPDRHPYVVTAAPSASQWTTATPAF